MVNLMNNKTVALASLCAVMASYVSGLEELVDLVKSVEMYGSIPGKRGPQLVSMLVTKEDVIEGLKAKFFAVEYQLTNIKWVCDVITESLAERVAQSS